MSADFDKLATNEYCQAPRYDLDRDELLQRTREFVDSHPPSSDSHYICYRIDDQRDEDIARTVERMVFEDTFGNDSAEMASLYGPYEAASRFFLTVDQQTGHPVGALRVITNSENGLMTLNTLPESIDPPSTEEIMAQHGIESLDDVWDVGTVAVLPEYRGKSGGVSVQLYRALYVSMMNEGVEHMISVIDQKPYETMTKYLGIPFEPLAGVEPFDYAGSAMSVATYGHVPDFFPKMDHKAKWTFTGRVLARKALSALVYGRKDAALEI